MKYTKTIFSNCLNIIGLTVSFVAFIIIIMQVSYDLNYDKCYKDYDKIYRFEHTFHQQEGSSMRSCNTSRPLARMIKEACPDIEELCELSKSDNNYLYKFRMSESPDASLIEVNMETVTVPAIPLLGVEMISGDYEKLKESNAVLISQKKAEEFFGKEDPIGKVVVSERGDHCTIVGVYKDFPLNSSFKNGLMVEIGKENYDDESNYNYSTLIKVNNSGNVDKILDEITEMLVKNMGDETIVENRDSLSSELRGKVFLTPISDIHYSKNVRYDWAEKANKATLYTLLSISILIIFIAIINFINFSIASIPLVIKDINTRKVLGSTNREIIMRKILQACIISIVSFVLALVIIHFLAGSSISSLFSASMALSENISIVLIALAIAVITGIVAGIYPAVYSSSFPPALVLKGSFSLSPKGRALRSGLIVFQYVISFVLIIVALFMNVQSRYMKHYDMGYTSENILTVWVNNNVSSDLTGFTARLQKNPQILDATFGSGMIVSNGKMGWGRNYKGNQVQFDCFPVSPNFIDFFGINVIEGRDFVESDETKETGVFIFNEKAVKSYGFQVGEKFYGHVNDCEVVGIVKDFNFMPLQYAISPIALYVFGSQPWYYPSFAYIKLAPGADIRGCMEHIRGCIIEMSPTTTDDNIVIKFMDDNIGRLYAKEDALNKMILIFCVLSVFLSIIGILGLIYFETQFKKKEIGVRRVMGSTVHQILVMLNTAYIKIMSISFIVAVPISIVIIKIWLKNFTYQSPIPVWIFIVAYCAILIITVLIITLRSLQAACANPVESLTSE